jgi:hypothetical protein
VLGSADSSILSFCHRNDDDNEPPPPPPPPPTPEEEEEYVSRSDRPPARRARQTFFRNFSAGFRGEGPARPSPPRTETDSEGAHRRRQGDRAPRINRSSKHTEAAIKPPSPWGRPERSQTTRHSGGSTGSCRGTLFWWELNPRERGRRGGEKIAVIRAPTPPHRWVAAARTLDPAPGGGGGGGRPGYRIGRTIGGSVCSCLGTAILRRWYRR